MRYIVAAILIGLSIVATGDYRVHQELERISATLALAEALASDRQTEIWSLERQKAALARRVTALTTPAQAQVVRVWGIAHSVCGAVDWSRVVTRWDQHYCYNALPIAEEASRHRLFQQEPEELYRQVVSSVRSMCSMVEAMDGTRPPECGELPAS